MASFFRNSTSRTAVPRLADFRVGITPFIETTFIRIRPSSCAMKRHRNRNVYPFIRAEFFLKTPFGSRIVRSIRDPFGEVTDRHMRNFSPRSAKRPPLPSTFWSAGSACFQGVSLGGSRQALTRPSVDCFRRRGVAVRRLLQPYLFKSVFSRGPFDRAGRGIWQSVAFRLHGRS